MSEWNPIETAPLDGTPVLLYAPGLNSWNRKKGLPDIVVGAFLPIDSGWTRTSWDGGATWHTHAWFSDIGDVDQGYESTGAYFVHERLQPSHWMAIPAAPEASDD